MPKYEPYPKVLKRGEGESLEQVTVLPGEHAAEEEARYRADGFDGPETLSPEQARKTVEADKPHLEYPKVLYRGDGDEREEVRVEPGEHAAEEEAAHRANGFKHVSDPADGEKAAKKSKGKKPAAE